jgi:MFS family permease
LGVFLSLVALFIWWELRVESPMMELRLFKRRLFSLGVSASFISFLGMSSVRFLMPFYLQAVKGYSPGQVGLIIVPSALCMTVLGPLSGRLSDRYGTRPFNVGGLLLSVSGLFLLSTIRIDSPLALVMAGMVLQSMGTGTFNAPNNSSILSTVEPSRYGALSGFLNLVRNSGNVTSIALVTAIVTASMASMGYEPNLSAVTEEAGQGVITAFTSGLRVACMAMGSLVVVGVAMSWLKGGTRAAAPARARNPQPESTAADSD